MTVLGDRHPIEAEHDLSPWFVLTLEQRLGEPVVAADDTGRLPTFATRELAERCAAAVNGWGVFDRVGVVPVRASFVAQLLAANVLGPDADREDLTDEEADRVLAASYVVEATALDAEDAGRQADELAHRIVKGFAHRIGWRPEGDT